METRAKAPLLLCAILLLLSLSVLALDALRWRSLSDEQMRWFQQRAGGLGMGAVAAPVWSVIDFDPRLQPVDESKLWPLPGGYAYSPASTSSVTHFREILAKSDFVKTSKEE
jgi:hypothetical protein